MKPGSSETKTQLPNHLVTRSPVIVGLTGSIASGKSVVMNEFKKLGAKIIDADKIGHLLLNQEGIKNKILKNFGKDILKNDGTIDRKKLGKIVFADKKKISLLNQIMHPPIIVEVKKKLHIFNQLPVTSHQSPVIILDAPLLFEAKINHLVDKIVLVYVSREVQLQRLQERNKLTRKEAEQRISCQWDIKKKIKFADFVIDNSKNFLSLQRQIKQIWNKLKE